MIYKILRKLLYVILAVCLLNSHVFYVKASNYLPKENYTIKEYESIINGIANEHGISIKVEYSPTNLISKDALNRELDKIKSIINDNKNKNNVFKDDFKILEKNNSSNLEPLYMPYNDVVYGRFVITKLPYGFATMVIKSNIIMDAQYDAVVQVNSSTAYQQGFFINYQNFVLNSINTYKKSARSLISHVKGRITFSYADSVTSITTGYTYVVDQWVTTSW